MSHSQNSEEAVLLKHFGDRTDGRLLEIGAWDFSCFSNSRALLLRGWSGVLVEPSPKPFASLIEAYRDRPDIQLVNVAVAPEAGLVPFYDAGGDALSTLSSEHRAKWPGVPYRETWVSAVTLAELLEKFPPPYDLISIDIEGGSADLLKRLPLFELERTGAIVCEHDGLADELRDYVAGFGMREAARNTENVIFLR